ncbi:MDR family MFS transporter [Bacillus dakarensis]|uniref:MDR family MFS transporter n=1 Tax=Robertmurraya dakarensis TaxID=1926278 RepID=UPI000981D2DF|nr:MDR family MFS transporter [Bacillus dakarensis]
MENLVLRKKILIMLAVMSAMLFAALNQTIVGTALPRIISDLDGINYYSWVFTMFMLTSSVTAILVGKLSDIYGRKIFMLIGIGIFTIGSFLCGLSESMIQLILYRGIQGFGAGMIMSTSFTVVGDLFSPRERGKWQGLLTSIFGISSLLGPTLGGWIVDNADWHWVFWVFLPIALVAFCMILFIYPKQAAKTKEPIDYFGSLFISLTLVPMLIALSWGGNNYAWSSSMIIFLFICSLVGFILFIYTEKRVSSPVLPLSLFKNKVFSLSNGIGFILGMGMFGAIMYMPFFVQGVLATTATKSGLIMMPMTLCMVTASAISGQLISKTGKYKRLVIIGILIMATGMYSLSLMDVSTSTARAVINIIFVGSGLGFCLPVIMISVQNAVSQSLLGVATSTVQLFRQLGGTIGVAVMGTIMNARLGTEVEQMTARNGLDKIIDENKVLAQLQDPQILIDHQQVEDIKANIPKDLQEVTGSLIEQVRESLGHSLTFVFMITSMILLMGFVLTFFLKEKPLRLTNSPKDTPANVTDQKKTSGLTSKQTN